MSRADNRVMGEMSSASGISIDGDDVSTSPIPAAKSNMPSNTTTTTDAGFRCDQCSLVTQVQHLACRVCGGLTFTRVGCVSLDDVNAYRAVVEAAVSGQIPSPTSQAEAIAMAPAATTLRGLTKTRATAPGKATKLINSIRDGRQAMAADAAEARQEARERRGKRLKKPKVPYTPPK